MVGAMKDANGAHLPSTLTQCAVCKCLLLVASNTTIIYVRAEWDRLEPVGIVFCSTCALMEKTKRVYLRR